MKLPPDGRTLVLEIGKRRITKYVAYDANTYVAGLIIQGVGCNFIN